MNYGGFSWTAADRTEIAKAFARIITRCAVLKQKIQKEIVRVKGCEDAHTQRVVLPELQYLVSTLDKITGLLQNDSTLYVYRYELVGAGGSDRGQSNSIISPYYWVAIDTGVPLNGSEDRTLFHELTHVFAGTIDDQSSGIFHNAHGLEDVYDNTSEMRNPERGNYDIGGGYGLWLDEVHKEAKNPPRRGGPDVYLGTAR